MHDANAAVLSVSTDALGRENACAQQRPWKRVQLAMKRIGRFRFGDAGGASALSAERALPKRPREGFLTRSRTARAPDVLDNVGELKVFSHCTCNSGNPHWLAWGVGNESPGECTRATVRQGRNVCKMGGDSLAGWFLKSRVFACADTRGTDTELGT